MSLLLSDRHYPVIYVRHIASAYQKQYSPGIDRLISNINKEAPRTDGTRRVDDY